MVKRTLAYARYALSALTSLGFGIIPN